jgi:hypothetical protein
MLKSKTIMRIEELVAARLPELDTSLKQEIARIGADLISRGLYNSSILVGDTKAAAERNIDQRAEVIQRTIKEVCQAHHVRHTHDTRFFSMGALLVLGNQPVKGGSDVL